MSWCSNKTRVVPDNIFLTKFHQGSHMITKILTMHLEAQVLLRKSQQRMEFQFACALKSFDPDPVSRSKILETPETL